MIHTVKGFGIVNKAEIDVFLELSCFFDDLTDVGKLISGSSTFSKTSKLSSESSQNSGNSVRLYFWGAPKSLQMLIAAMKLKEKQKCT